MRCATIIAFSGALLVASCGEAEVAAIDLHAPAQYSAAAQLDAARRTATQTARACERTEADWKAALADPHRLVWHDSGGLAVITLAEIETLMGHHRAMAAENPGSVPARFAGFAAGAGIPSAVAAAIVGHGPDAAPATVLAALRGSLPEEIEAGARVAATIAAMCGALGRDVDAYIRQLEARRGEIVR